MTTLKARLAAGASIAAVCCAALPVAAHAQTETQGQTAGQAVAVPADVASANPDQLANADDADIVVTGFRRSLDLGTRIKRDSTVIVDAISAEDIGEFPDQNLAESLQRVTGVQITRNRGEGSSISVRGLSPSFVRTQYNGRTFVSGGGRSFDFQTLSALFVSAVEVQKTPTSDLVEGGLSATVNVRTAQPLEVGKTTATASVEGVYEDLANKVTPRIAGLVNYVNTSKTFGVNFGVAYEKRKPLQFLQLSFGAETTAESAKNPPIDYNRDGDFNDTYSFDHAQEFDAQPGDRERLTFVGGAQFRPSETVELYGDAFYSEFRDDYLRYDVQSRFTNIAPARAGDPFGVRRSTIDTSFNDRLLGGSQGFLTEIDADGVDIRADTTIVKGKTKTFSGSAGAKLNFGNLDVQLEGAYSDSLFRGSYDATSVLARGSAVVTRPDGLGGLPLVNYTRGYDPLNPANFNFNFFSFASFSTHDRDARGKIDLKYKVGDGIIRSIRGGADYSQRKYNSDFFFGGLDAQELSSLSQGRLPFQANVEGGSVNAGSFLSPLSYNNSGIPGFPRSFLVVDLAKLYSFASPQQIETVSAREEQLGNGINITETTWAAYARADFADSADRFGGNIGVRYVNTRLVSSGFGSDLDNITISPGGIQSTVPVNQPLTFRNDYEYFLPSLNLKYDLTRQLRVRFAAARVLARPDFGQLGVSSNVNANVLTINSANPNLKPYLSDQLDLSFEYYLPRSGLISVAFFYKAVSNFIVNGQVLDTRTARLADGGTRSLTFRRNQPINLETVNLKGVEVGAQIPLAFLPSPFDGFGVFGNGTYVDAPQVPAEQNGLPFPLPGVSKFTYNIGGYYEKGGFGIRGSYNWRGRYETGQNNYFGDREFTQAYGQFDGSISYQLNPAIRLSADVTNAFNAKTNQVNSFGLSRALYNVGRRFTAGVGFKF